MSEEMDNVYIFAGPNDLIDFLLKGEGETLNEVRKKIPPFSNLCTLKKSLDVKPCGCGGTKPAEVMKRRAEELDSFYAKLIALLADNFQDKLDGDVKSFVKEEILKNTNGAKGISFRLKGETLLDLI